MIKPTGSKALSRRGYAAAIIALAAVIFVAVNLVSTTLFRTARLDLTENGLFTLSQGTRNIIAKVDEPITLRFFYSKNLTAQYAQVNDYARRVRDLLQEYEDLSGGKIKVEEIDPEPFSEAEDQATAAGITGQALESGEEVYFGLSGTNSVDARETIAYFAPSRENYLEYDVSSLIYRLSNPKKPELAILTSLPLAGQPGVLGPFAIYGELSRMYDIDMLAPQFTQIPSSANVLLIVHPGLLSEEQSYAIDQFVLGGGRALVFVDPKSELAEGLSMSGGGAAISSDLMQLFESWGIAYDTRNVVGDKELAIRVGSGNQGEAPSSYPIWMRLGKDQFNPEDPLSADFAVMNFISAGALSPLKDATTKFTPLATSSTEASLLTGADLQMYRPQDLMGAVKPTGQRYTLAARVSGPAKTAYPDKNGRKDGNVNVIVVADTDMLSDRFWLQTQQIGGQVIGTPFADNYALVLNGVENLSGSDDLISLRVRATRDRSFQVVRQLQAQADEQFREQDEALQQKLQATQQRLAELEKGSGQSGNTVSAAQGDEIEQFRRQLIDTRASLREVQRNLRKDIDALGDLLAFINVALVPILVAVFALVVTFVRRRRRTQALAQRSA